jgi:KamA family protein
MPQATAVRQSEKIGYGLDTARFKVYTQRDLGRIEQLKSLTDEMRFDIGLVSSVLPFRVNQYVINELIDWDNVPDDPIFQLTFPQKGMLTEAQYEQLATVYRNGSDEQQRKDLIDRIRCEMNPHPAGQLEMNIPQDESGSRFDGIQHKYRETVLFFPSQGQTCHSYCSFCFRWAQFIGDKSLRIASNEAERLHHYLKSHREVTDLLITGGDPMVMKTKHLKAYLEPLLKPEFDHIQHIRIGTKALTFWPQRFVTDSDADELLNLFTRINDSGKHIAIMAHYNHWREITTDIAEQAIIRLRDSGSVIRSQGPLLANINDHADDWSRLWKAQVNLGIVPYYMFVARDTGAQNYFKMPLARAWQIYHDALSRVSGLARTARGPSMSAGPGKVEVQGISEIGGEKVFVLRFLQGRNADWTHRPFFAKYDEQASWLDELKPAFGEQRFFFEDEYEAMGRG